MAWLIWACDVITGDTGRMFGENGPNLHILACTMLGFCGESLGITSILGRGVCKSPNPLVQMCTLISWYELLFELLPHA